MATDSTQTTAAEGLSQRLLSITEKVLQAAAKLDQHVTDLLGVAPPMTTPTNAVSEWPQEKPTSTAAHLHRLEEAVTLLWQNLERL